MTILSNTRRKLAAGGIVAATVLGGSGAVYAATTSTTPAAPATHTSVAHHRRGFERGLLRLARRADHATVEVKRHGTWQTFTFDRGMVTADTATSITLKRPDGVTVTLAVKPGETRFRGTTVSSNFTQEVTTGHRALVISQGGTALRIAERRAG